MKKAAFVAVLLAAATVAGYLYFFSGSVVDEAYLESDEYRSLQNQIEREKDGIKDRESVLMAVVQKMLARPDKYRRGVPFHLDSLALDSLMIPENKITIEVSNEFENYRFYGINIFYGKGFNGALALVQLPGGYQNIEIGLVTFRDTSVVDVALIGRYTKNVMENTHTELLVDKDLNIKAGIEKVQLYPVAQENTVHYQYTISKRGFINVSLNK